MAASGIPAHFDILPKDWPSLICSIVHAIIAIYAIGTLCADRLVAVKPRITGPHGHVTVASKSKYHRSSKLSILLSTAGAAIFAAGPGFAVDYGPSCLGEELRGWLCIWPMVSHSK